jgi:hypothetical protein
VSSSSKRNGAAQELCDPICIYRARALCLSVSPSLCISLLRLSELLAAAADGNQRKILAVRLAIAALFRFVSVVFYMT